MQNLMRPIKGIHQLVAEIRPLYDVKWLKGGVLAIGGVDDSVANRT